MEPVRVVLAEDQVLLREGLARLLTDRRIATAESCTGGLVAGALTDIPGSSDVIDRGFVSYSNASKSDLVGVDPALIDAHGAVSAEVARAMAEGGLAHAHVDLAIAVTVSAR